ncbi:MAG TPA: DUF6535 domain-containing protein, partial [Chlamydiales bacterium]|nr:DUF6535 domain-containing protein [Chlamydiales bacterium]
MFAGVVASFLVDSRRDLQPDPQVALLANIHSALLNEPSLGPELFVLRTSTLWINGLWFVSLLVTLFSATTAVVAKGWISNFRSVSERRKNSTTAFERWLLDTMADRWYLEYFVAFVPLALQVALLLFSLGFALQVLNDNKTLGWTVLVMVLFGVFCYIIMTIINIWAPQCPLQTPLSTLLLDLKDSLWPESQNGKSQRQIVHLGEGSRMKMVSSHTEKDMARIIQENLLQSSNTKHVDEALAELGRTPLSNSLYDYLIRAKAPRILLNRLQNRVALRMYDDQALLASHLQTLLSFIRYFNLKPSSTALKKIFS